MMVLVSVPVLYREIEKYRQGLEASFENFLSAFSERVTFLIVVQSKDELRLPDWLLHHKNIVSITVNWMSVSRARNLSLEFARSKGFEKIVFHDASLIYPTRVCEFFETHYSESVVKACAEFGRSERNSISCKIRRRKLGRIDDYYVWLYMFSVKDLNHIFEERFGPGEYTKYKSGEDFIFMANFIESFGNLEVHEIRSPKIWHPARPKDFSKHLHYAYGQGKMFQVLLNEFFKVKYFLWFLVFIGNSAFRVLLFKPNSFSILKQRLKGFFSKRRDQRF